MKRILIVEHDRIAAGALRVRLSAAGYDVQMVFNGARAPDAIVKYSPDLILMGVQMPDGFGSNLPRPLVEIRKARVPVILIAKGKTSALRNAARAMGAAGYFHKPIDSEKLLEGIATALATPSADSQPSSPHARRSEASGRRRILVLEDDRNITNALQIRLNAAGYEVWVARNGLVALELARGYRPDLLLSDVRMPMGFGCTIIDHLAQAGLPDLPVIFMTASNEKSVRHAALRLGAAAFFEKPYDTDALLAAIGQALNHRPSAAARASN